MTYPTTEAVHVGLVGLGNSGWYYHAEANLVGSSQYVLTAVCSSDGAEAGRAATTFGCRPYEDWRELLKDPDLELVVIALPHHLHKEVAIAAANAGKHVLVEKPMAVTTQDADAMIRAAEKAGVVLSVFQQRRWEEDLQAIRSAVDRGDIGKVWSIEVARSHAGKYRNAGRDKPHVGDSILEWAHQQSSGGGISYVVGPHPVDALLQLADEPVKTVAGRVHYAPGEDVDDYVGAEVVFQSGLLGRVDVYRRPGIAPPRFVLYGDKGTLVSADGTAVIIHPFDGEERVIGGLSRPGRLGEQVYAGLFQAIRNGAAPPVTALQGRAVVDVLELSLRSASVGGAPLPSTRLTT